MNPSLLTPLERLAEIGSILLAGHLRNRLAASRRVEPSCDGEKEGQ
jgi:hypothetical protein